jgi:hypothetical protein
MGVWRIPSFRIGLLSLRNEPHHFGLDDIVMLPRWQFMRLLEGLNGMLLVGLSAAVLFTMVQQVARSSVPQSSDLFGV